MEIDFVIVYVDIKAYMQQTCQLIDLFEIFN